MDDILPNRKIVSESSGMGYECLYAVANDLSKFTIRDVEYRIISYARYDIEHVNTYIDKNAKIKLNSDAKALGKYETQFQEDILKHPQNYKVNTNYLLTTDSLRVAQMSNYKLINREYSIQIDNLNKAIKKKDRAVTCWKIGGITVSIGLVLFLLLK